MAAGKFVTCNKLQLWMGVELFKSYVGACGLGMGYHLLNYCWIVQFLLKLTIEFHFIHGQKFIRYRDIMGHLFGKQMYYVTLISQFSTFVLGNMGFILLGGKALKEINLVFTTTTMRLQYFIIITGVVYLIFSFVVPNLSAMRVWLGASTILTFGYIGVLIAATIPDGKSNRHTDYEIKGSTTDKVFNGFGAISAMIVSNNSGMIPEIQSTLREPAIKNLKRALSVQLRSTKTSSV